jgi:hypothetical protein
MSSRSNGLLMLRRSERNKIVAKCEINCYRNGMEWGNHGGIVMNQILFRRGERSISLERIVVANSVMASSIQ